MCLTGGSRRVMRLNQARSWASRALGLFLPYIWLIRGMAIYTMNTRVFQYQFFSKTDTCVKILTKFALVYPCIISLFKLACFLSHYCDNPQIHNQ